MTSGEEGAGLAGLAVCRQSEDLLGVVNDQLATCRVVDLIVVGLLVDLKQHARLGVFLRGLVVVVVLKALLVPFVSGGTAHADLKTGDEFKEMPGENVCDDVRR